MNSSSPVRFTIRRRRVDPRLTMREGAMWCVLAVAATGFGCDSKQDTSSSEPKSRVQAVVQSAPTEAERQAPAEPKPTGPTIGTGGGSSAGSPTPTKKPRPPLCAGQTKDPGSPFNPRREPEQRSAGGDANLPTDPLSGKGERWTWINFWAAWCKPCKEELPILLKWQAELTGKLDFAFISFDDDQRQLDGFLEEQPNTGLTKTYWLPDGGARIAWLKALNMEVEPELPMQLLIDPKGHLRCTVQGAIDEGDLDVLKEIVSGS